MTTAVAADSIPEVLGATVVRNQSVRSVFGSALRARFLLPAEVGRGFIDDFAFPGAFSGGMCNFALDKDAAEAIPGEGLLKFHFKLSGNNTLKFADGTEQTVTGGNMSVLIHPEGLGKLDCHPRGVHEHSVTFLCRPYFLSETLGLDPETLPEPLRGYALGRDPQFHLRTYPLSPMLRCDLQALLGLRSESRFGNLRVQARCLDLIASMLEVMAGENQRTASLHLSPRDIRSLEEARHVLESDLSTIPTLAELARRVGLNRNKLTRGFRELFGESVQEFGQRLRMQRARELVGGGMPAGEVAARVGYLHQSSFTQAFSAFFGMSPRELRRPRGPVVASPPADTTTVVPEP